ncbi:MAG: hypothetical protein H5T73_03000 [Actinobacteria bacterium]|nr:hypothetical protein [Actinomycetota bacterium]
MSGRYVMRRVLALLAACVLLAGAASLLASCGKGGGGSGGSGGSKEEVRIEDRGDVDALLKDLDATMDSVDAEDFSADQLSDGELGL